MRAPTLPLVRTAAVLTAAGTVLFLFIGGDWRWDNLFLLPDLALSLILLTGALLPAGPARTVLAAGFAFAAGVFSAATMSYVVEGRFGPGATFGLLTALALSAWLHRDRFHAAG